MDPYSNGYNPRGSVPNRNPKYQSPGFGKHQYGPQYAQQQAQHYQKGPANQQQNNGRKHAYSVDQQRKLQNPPNPNYMRQEAQKQRQYEQQMEYNQYQQYPQQQQQQQQQQQYMQPPQHQPKINKNAPKTSRRKQRTANSPIPDDMQAHFFSDDLPDPNSKQNPNRPQQRVFPDTDPSKPHKNPRRQKNNNNPRRNRSKSPYEEEYPDRHRTRQPKTKQSVPNVMHSPNNNQHIAEPQNNRRTHHQSTPNANHHQPSRDRQRRRKKTPQHPNDAQHKHREHRVRSKSRQHPDDAQHNDDHEHHQRVNKVRRNRKSPNPDHHPSQVQQAQQEQEQQQGKKRRHTTAPRTERKKANKSQDPDRRRRGKKKSKSPNPHRKSAADIGQQHDKLNKGKLAEKFVIKEKLGRGNFSVVRRVVRKEDGRAFAAKIISTRTMSQQEINDTHDEVDILAKLHHPNVVSLVDYIFTPRHLYIVLELLNGGELFERLQKRKRFNEQMAAQITKQIADALMYMHGKGIVHRDLKPENILYENQSANAKIKISDFGLSRDTKSGRPLKTSCGTPGYVAPEIIRQQAYDETVDLWAAGVIIYILLCGYPPFIGAGVDTQQSMFRKIKSGKYTYPKREWGKISACAMDCIDSLLCVNPKDRMSAKELLEHPWIKQAEMRNEDSFMDIHFQSNLSNYLHKKRFRRGVRLIITLNRMVRGAGLETTARDQRREFRTRLKQYKEQLKAQQRKIYNKQQQTKMMIHDDDYDDEYMGYTIIDPDITPAIDYSKV